MSALLKYVRAQQLRPDTAQRDLEFVRSLSLDSKSSHYLAPAALRIALARGVSAHDAMYLALAEATGSVLITADRGLAAATERAELLED